jgi:tetratricopeptide (TPR) repeat protein
LYILGNYQEAVTYLQESLQCTKFLYGPQSIEIAQEMQKYAEVLLHAGKKQECIQSAEEALNLFEMHYGKDCDFASDLKKLISVAKYAL